MVAPKCIDREVLFMPPTIKHRQESPQKLVDGDIFIDSLLLAARHLLNLFYYPPPAIFALLRSNNLHFFAALLLGLLMRLRPLFMGCCLEQKVLATPFERESGGE
jgi:hypothetical protein